MVLATIMVFKAKLHATSHTHKPDTLYTSHEIAQRLHDEILRHTKLVSTHTALKRWRQADAAHSRDVSVGNAVSDAANNPELIPAAGYF